MGIYLMEKIDDVAGILCWIQERCQAFFLLFRL